jgi:hypothetical protein
MRDYIIKMVFEFTCASATYKSMLVWSKIIVVNFNKILFCHEKNVILIIILSFVPQNVKMPIFIDSNVQE